MTDLWPKSTKTVSKPNSFPSSLLQKHSSKIQTIDWGAFESWPVVSQPCPRCNDPEMYFRELQMRSADEGTTIFYRCPKCNHTYVQSLDRVDSECTNGVQVQI